MEKTQKRNPKRDQAKVDAKRHELSTKFAQWSSEILTGKRVVVDQSQLLWGDVCGYVWGKTSQRIEVPVGNQRKRQTYYGTLDLMTGRVLVIPYKKGDSKYTIEFLTALQQHYPDTQLVIRWDTPYTRGTCGATYHRSDVVKTYLANVNHDLSSDKWKITCIRLAPNAPDQNPIEDVWRQAKRLVRKSYHKCIAFSDVKNVFNQPIENVSFRFDKLSQYQNLLHPV